MEEHHIELDTKAVKPFLRTVLRVAHRLKEREEAQQNLDNHLTEMKKASAGKKKIDPHMHALKEHISNLVNAEKKLAGYRRPSDSESPALADQISELQAQLLGEREDHAREMALYKSQIDEMKSAFSDIKAKMLEMIGERRSRENRLEKLQERIRRSAQPTDSPHRISR